jgi:hypothetical protein
MDDACEYLYHCVLEIPNTPTPPAKDHTVKPPKTWDKVHAVRTAIIGILLSNLKRYQHKTTQRASLARGPGDWSFHTGRLVELLIAAAVDMDDWFAAEQSQT